MLGVALQVWLRLHMYVCGGSVWSTIAHLYVPMVLTYLNIVTACNPCVESCAALVCVRIRECVYLHVCQVHVHMNGVDSLLAVDLKSIDRLLSYAFMWLFPSVAVVVYWPRSLV